MASQLDLMAVLLGRSNLRYGGAGVERSETAFCVCDSGSLLGGVRNGGWPGEEAGGVNANLVCVR